MSVLFDSFNHNQNLNALAECLTMKQQFPHLLLARRSGTVVETQLTPH